MKAYKKDKESYVTYWEANTDGQGLRKYHR